jgi:O-antigen ligase
MYLFPVYKHDSNPFAQAHNFYLQQLFECGLIGLGVVVWWVLSLAIRLYRAREYALVAGMVMISTNMMFCFPERMTQTAPLLIAYLALCQLAVVLAERSRSA